MEQPFLLLQPVLRTSLIPTGATVRLRTLYQTVTCVVSQPYTSAFLQANNKSYQTTICTAILTTHHQKKPFIPTKSSPCQTMPRHLPYNLQITFYEKAVNMVTGCFSSIYAGSMGQTIEGNDDTRKSCKQKHKLCCI